MNYTEKLERRIKALENKIAVHDNEILEARVAKLEKMLLEDKGADDLQKTPEDYLMILLNMLFKSRKVNPNGNSMEGNIRFFGSNGVEVLNRAIGEWDLESVEDKGYTIITDDRDPSEYKRKDVKPVPGKPGEYIHPNPREIYHVFDKYSLVNEVEIKKIIGAFCKINKCIVDFNLFSVGTGPEGVLLQFTLKKSPTFQPPRFKPRWGYSDSDWETNADHARRHNDFYHNRYK